MSSTGSHDGKAAALNVSLFGNVLKLSFQETDQYAGLVACEPLGKVMRDFSVLLTARVLSTERPGGKKAQKSVQSPATKLPVRVILHGLMAEKDAVGSFLSDHDLFFQHPFPSELDSSVPYFNPHYLLRPGSQMPDIGRLSLRGSTDEIPEEVLDDVSKARLMRVFNSAYDPEGSIEAKPSPRLKTTLERWRTVAPSYY